MPAAAGPDGERRRFFGRRRGRALRPGRQALVDTLLPRLTPRLPDGTGAFDPLRLFEPPARDLWLEIGFGGGEHLAWQARQHPDIGFLCGEPYLNGVAKLLSAIERDGLRNVRIVADDLRPWLDALADRAAGSVGRIFVLFPDPWPKSRHHKRRVINRHSVSQFAAMLRGGAELRLASDVDGYVEWMLRHVLAHPEFEWLARRPADWRARPPDWPRTRYEAKAVAAGRRPVFLRFRRRARDAARAPEPCDSSGDTLSMQKIPL